MPGPRGTGGEGATCQESPFDCPEIREPLQELCCAGKIVVQKGIAFSSMSEEVVHRSMCRTGSPRKQELMYRHSLCLPSLGDAPGLQVPARFFVGVGLSFGVQLRGLLARQ